MIHWSREISCKYGRSRMECSIVICDIHCSKNSDRIYRFTGWVFWYIFILNGESRVSFFLVFVIVHCHFHWAYLNVESDTYLNSWKVSSRLPIWKKKTHSWIIKMWLNFIHMYTVEKSGLSHMSRWQSVSLVLWVKRHNLLNNRALQINIPLKKTRGQWCYNELCPVGIKIWPCPQMWSCFHKCI